MPNYILKSPTVYEQTFCAKNDGAAKQYGSKLLNYELKSISITREGESYPFTHREFWEKDNKFGWKKWT